MLLDITTSKTRDKSPHQPKDPLEPPELEGKAIPRVAVEAHVYTKSQQGPTIWSAATASKQ